MNYIKRDLEPTVRENLDMPEMIAGKAQHIVYISGGARGCGVPAACVRVGAGMNCLTRSENLGGITAEILDEALLAIPLSGTS